MFEPRRGTSALIRVSAAAAATDARQQQRQPPTRRDDAGQDGDAHPYQACEIGRRYVIGRLFRVERQGEGKQHVQRVDPRPGDAVSRRAFDEAAFRELRRLADREGSSALVPCGTTGESATMSIDEHNHVVAVCVEQAAGRVPVIAGCGSNDTRDALAHMRARQGGGRRRGAGRAALLQPAEPGRACIAHFAALAEHCDLPIILYNVPGRTVDRHRRRDDGAAGARCPTIVGVKDATRQARARVAPSGSPAAPTSASCRAMTTWRSASWRWAGAGCISVTANVAPRLCAEFQTACAAGDWDGRAGAAGPALPAPRRAVHRCLAGAGQICAVAGAARLSGRPAPADDPAVARPAARRSTRRWRMPG